MRLSVDFGFVADVVEDTDGTSEGAGDGERARGRARGSGSSSGSEAITMDAADAVLVLCLPPTWKENCFGGTGEAGVTEMWGLAKLSAKGATFCFDGSGAEYEREGIVNASGLGLASARGKPFVALALSGGEEDAVVYIEVDE